MASGRNNKPTEFDAERENVKLHLQQLKTNFRGKKKLWLSNPKRLRLS